MKYSFRPVLLIGLIAFVAIPLIAQSETHGTDKKKYKVVFQLTSGDTLVHKALVKQIGHVLEEAPNSKIEVVCHSGGLPFLVAAQTRVAAKIKELKGRGVEFYACENTMRDRNVQRSDLVPESGTVPSGIVEIIRKQEKRWAYIKAGLYDAPESTYGKPYLCGLFLSNFAKQCLPHRLLRPRRRRPKTLKTNPSWRNQSWRNHFA